MAHVLAKELREAVLQAAMSGKLTEQLSTDTPVEETLKQIAKEKDRLIKEKKIKKENPLPEIDEDEVPFDIPESWQWVRLKSVCSKIVDGDHNPPHGIEKSDYLMLSAVNINNGKIVELEKCRFLSKEVFEKENERTNLLKDDVLLTIVGTLGRSCVFNGNGKFCFQRSVAVITTMINPLFLKYYFDNPYVQNYMNKNSTGTAQKGFYLDRLNSLLLTLPPIEEQARIVAKVDELMAKIDEYEKLENQLVHLKEQFPKDMKDSLLQAGMMGKLTEQLPTDTRIDKYYDAVMSEVKKTSRKDITTPLNDDLEDDLVDLPNNWMYARLNDLVSKEIRRGKSPKYSEVGTALAFAQKCNSKYSGIRLDLARCLSDSSLNRYSEEDNMHDKDIVINSTGGGTLGRVGLYEDKFNPNGVLVYPDSHVTVVRIKKTVNAMYIYYCIKQQSEYLETLGEGSTNQTELKPQSVKDLIIPLPPIEEQARIVTKLDQLLPLVESLEVN